MKKLYTLAALFIAAMALAQAGAPASPYWNGFNFNQSGTALKTALATKITNTHTHFLTYSNIWDALVFTDQDPANTTNVLLIYGSGTTRSRDKSLQCGGGNCNGTWNREHTYAQSIGTPDLGTTGPGSDAHHLRACDYALNENRASEKYADGTGTAHDVTSTSWYPGDEWKGDVARMMMYMYLRYGSQCLPTNVGVGTAVATDANMIDLFLQWNAQDPVSAYEDQRNTYLGSTSATYRQGNRNPFIDNPYLATLIWGGTPAENRWPTLALPQVDDAFSLVSVYPNPSSDNRINIDSDVVLDEIQLISINGQIIQQIKNPVFQDHTYTMDNLPRGFYFLRLGTDDKSV
ncbi:MAG: T9SS type A sorting domain-containing protein, partial [Sphingobacteriales bacterium]